ncbi:hypothetical protein EVJ58_g8403 [Rhodofomes roseus]|uniref:Uncharacterized protein n=1 Tax=Rhodofomes roseus TaxID=34475 RepID=A0A4Y9XYK9_9APHY|nr:hypothetical protein EVJ58_g8403 [Rhodofomes roseus]
MSFETITDHLDAIDALCPNLKPASPHTRTFAEDVCDRLTHTYRLISATLFLDDESSQALQHVLLDPVWSTDRLVCGRSRLFVPVLDALSTRLPAVLPSQCHASSTVVTIVTALANDTIAAHVKLFVDSHPPS